MLHNLLLAITACFFVTVVVLCCLVVPWTKNPNVKSCATESTLGRTITNSNFQVQNFPNAFQAAVGTTESPRSPKRRAPESRFTTSDFESHVKELTKTIPHRGFHIVIQKPFVVIGDEAPEVVERRSVRTVKWAVDHLKKDFFDIDPNEIVDIWLFKDKKSYEKHNKTLFGSVPSTPFGFYSPTNKALVMNISTGGGTLVHEIVHPFIESNFPDCPAWFNEGLASLYEQCGTKNEKIWGHTNWRLRGLQEAIKAQRIGSFKELCETTTRAFYGDERGTNYSQARYLCYYLQEKGLLRDYYKTFRKNAQRDKTGYKTLVAKLGSPDMDKFNRDWQAFVMKLRF